MYSYDFGVGEYGYRIKCVACSKESPRDMEDVLIQSKIMRQE